MQDDLPQREDLNAKWGRIYHDILSACGKLVTVEGGIEFDSYENSVDLSEFDCDPDHSQAAFVGDDPPQDEPEEPQSENSDASGIIKTWDVDLEEFLNDVGDATTMLGTANELDLDAEGNKVVLDSGLNEIDPDLEGSSQDGLEDKEDLMPFFSLFVYFISLMVISGVVFCISLFLL